MLTASLQVLMKDRLAVLIWVLGALVSQTIRVETYPVFAQGLFTQPRDATGKIV